MGIVWKAINPTSFSSCDTPRGLSYFVTQRYGFVTKGSFTSKSQVDGSVWGLNHHQKKHPGWGWRRFTPGPKALGQGVLNHTRGLSPGPPGYHKQKQKTKITKETTSSNSNRFTYSVYFNRVRRRGGALPILRIQWNPVDSQASYEFTDILWIPEILWTHRHPTNSQTSYEFTEIL